MNSPLLRLENLCYHYTPQRPLLNDVNLSLFASERVAIVGANGCGKTSLLHLIVGLLKPTAGIIEIFGKIRRIEVDFVEVRTKVGLLFQDADDQLFCPTVAEDVAFGVLNLGKSRAEAQIIVRNTLNQLGLENYANRVTHRLSGGEKRMVSLATVLAMQPEILLLDEPTTGLDEQAQARITEILAQLPQAMLIVSHDRNFLGQLTDKTLYLRK